MEIVNGILKKIDEQDIKNGVIIVPNGVTEIGKFVFQNCNVPIILPNSITTIGDSAFVNCTSLKELPNSITTVGRNAFEGCTSLEKLSDNIITVDTRSFKGCTALKELPDSIIEIGERAFEGCTSLEKMSDNIITVGKFAFADCTSLKKISNSAKTVDDYAFWGCTSLEELPDSIITVGDGAFVGCTSLKKISNNITTVGMFAFQNCPSLEKLPDSITTVGESTFSGCISLEALPDSITTIGDSSFWGCTSLKKLPDSITTIGEDAFKSCPSLEEIPNSITEIGAGAFSGCPSLKKIPNSITTVKEHAFQGCTSLEELPDSIITVGDGAFVGCTSLKKISNNITTVGMFAFQNCPSLEKLPDSITTVAPYAFLNCTSLERIPDSITTIGDSAFSGCTSLKEIPDNITTVGEGTFKDCPSLKKLPNSITTVGNWAFQNCPSLEEMPDSIIEIGRNAFKDCISLKKMSNNITTVGEYAFQNCPSLEKISDSITEIGENAFEGCTSLEGIPSGVTTIGKGAFDKCTSLTNTPWGKIDLKEYKTKEVIMNYLYLYANSILKEKYHDINEFMENPYIQDLMNSENIYKDNSIAKFKNLFHKMRKQYNIPPQLFPYLLVDTTKDFDFNIWNKIKDTFSYASEEMAKAFAEMIEVFGLFHKDEQQKNRIQQFQKLFSKESYIILEHEYQLEGKILKNAFRKTAKPYYKRTAEEVPTEFQIYLTYPITEEKKRRVKKLSGTYGSEINKFFKENYQLEMTKVYELKEEAKNNPKVNELLYQRNFRGHINYPTLHRIFDGCEEPFDPEFYDFFMDNLGIILEDEKIQTNIRNIQHHFKNIKEYYLRTSGKKEITIKQALDYINNQSFDYKTGNYEFQEEVRKAGVTEQKAFNYYQDIYEKNKVRKLYSLVRRSNTYEVNGYTIKAELLRKDDPFGLLVGEKNYTNCCQIFGGAGQNCMAHATNSEDGGIFVTKLLKGGEWILLTESWDWQNNNLYCHDNIEGTPYFTNGEKSLKEAVAKTFKLDAEYIIEESKKEIGEYIRKRRKILEKSFGNDKEEELKKLDELEKREVIKVVTSGEGYDDLGLEQHFENKLSVDENQFINGKTFTLQNFQPVEYNSGKPYFDKDYSAYSDAGKTQYIISGSLENLYVDKIEPLIPIYRDGRKIVIEKNSIRDDTLNKIQNIELYAYPKEMIVHGNNFRGDYQDETIYLGEDWYLVYEEKENNSIYISDLAKINPDLEDEKGIQIEEMMNIIYKLLRKYDKVEADLKEDTSYLLYLMNKRLGYIEQIGEDLSYSYNDESNKKITSIEEQEQILRNRKKIREEKNPELRMHHVTFKKGRLLEQNNITNQNRTKRL